MVTCTGIFALEGDRFIYFDHVLSVSFVEFGSAPHDFFMKDKCATIQSRHFRTINPKLGICDSIGNKSGHEMLDGVDRLLTIAQNSTPDRKSVVQGSKYK